MKRGDIILADLEPIKGSEQGGIRPCLIIQNNLGNKFSPTIIIAPLTSKQFIKTYKTTVFIEKEISGLHLDSTIILNQIKTIDKQRIKKKISSLDNFTMIKVDSAIKVSLELNLKNSLPA